MVSSRRVAAALLVLVGWWLPVWVSTVSAEWYVAGQIGVNFADQLSDIRGTGDLNGFRAPAFDLKNALVYGAKVGVFPGKGWYMD